MQRGRFLFIFCWRKCVFSTGFRRGQHDLFRHFFCLLFPRPFRLVVLWMTFTSWFEPIFFTTLFCNDNWRLRGLRVRWADKKRTFPCFGVLTSGIYLFTTLCGQKPWWLDLVSTLSPSVSQKKRRRENGRNREEKKKNLTGISHRVSPEFISPVEKKNAMRAGSALMT